MFWHACVVEPNDSCHAKSGTTHNQLLQRGGRCIVEVDCTILASAVLVIFGPREAGCCRGVAIPYAVPMVDRLLWTGCVEGEFAPEKFVLLSCDTINRLDANYSHD